MAICPFVRAYIDKIAIVETDNYQKSINHAVNIMKALGLEAVVYHGKRESYDKMHRIVENSNKRHKNRDVEILLMHPDTEDPPLPYNYTYKHSPLVIVQVKSTLEKHRKQLENKTDYYKYYK
jgi:hypothetical protein